MPKAIRHNNLQNQRQQRPKFRSADSVMYNKPGALFLVSSDLSDREYVEVNGPGLVDPSRESREAKLELLSGGAGLVGAEFLHVTLIFLRG